LFFFVVRIIMEELVLGPEVWEIGKGRSKYEYLADGINDLDDHAWSMDLHPNQARSLEKRDLDYEVSPLDTDPFSAVFERESEANRARYERKKSVIDARFRYNMEAVHKMLEDQDKKLQLVLSVRRFKRRILIDVRNRLLDKYYYTLTPAETQAIQRVAQTEYNKWNADKKQGDLDSFRKAASLLLSCAILQDVYKKTYPSYYKEHLQAFDAANTLYQWLKRVEATKREALRLSWSGAGSLYFRPSSSSDHPETPVIHRQLSAITVAARADALDVVDLLHSMGCTNEAEVKTIQRIEEKIDALSELFTPNATSRFTARPGALASKNYDPERAEEDLERQEARLQLYTERYVPIYESALSALKGAKSKRPSSRYSAKTFYRSKKKGTKRRSFSR